MDYPQVTSIQIQSVIYNNDAPSLLSAVAAIANAVRVYQKTTGNALKVHLIYGDASSEPVFDENAVLSIRNTYREYISFDYRFFGFNSGTAKGHNLLAEGFTGEYYMIMNPDVKVAPTHFLRMIEPFLRREKVGLVEARQTPFEHHKEYNETTMETEWASTACALVRKEAFDSVGGFDSESFFLYCDDVDFSWQLRLNGWKILYQPLAPVYHAKTLSSQGKSLPSNAEVYYSAFGHLMMAYKWSNPVRLAKLKELFKKSELPLHQKALKDFLAIPAEKLPKRLDPAHKVSHFVGDYYAENRFVI